MTAPADILLLLYSANEQLQRALDAFTEQGDTEGAAHCRASAVEIVHAISCVVRKRAEQAREVTP